MSRDAFEGWKDSAEMSLEKVVVNAALAKPAKVSHFYMLLNRGVRALKFPGGGADTP